MTETISIGLLLPQRGPIGMWGLSCENCASLAISELNSAGGILGKEISYELIDASGPPKAVAERVQHQVRANGVNALIGMHTSDIRVEVAKQIRSSVPYVYTPLYEGGEADKTIFLVGQTPEQQTKPMVAWMAAHLGARRWYLIGNNYNYPYVSNQRAKEFINDEKGVIVGERYISAEQENFSEILSEIASSKPDVVFINLIGCSNVRFNRAFGKSGLSENIIRYCAVLEENTILGIGAENTDGIFSSTAYKRPSADTNAFALEKLYTHYFGDTAPLLNQFASSCYEGIFLLSALAEQAKSIDVEPIARLDQHRVTLHGPRGELALRDNHLISSTSVVKLSGLNIECLEYV